MLNNLGTFIALHHHLVAFLLFKFCVIFHKYDKKNPGYTTMLPLKLSSNF